MRRNLIHNREYWVLLILVVISLVIRTALVARVDRIVRWDEPDYLILGKHLFTGEGFTVSGQPELHYAPLFPIATGLLYPLTHNMKLNSDIGYVFFGTLLLLPFYWLARRLFGAPIAVLATAFLCLYPPLTAGVLFWGTMLEPLYLFLLFSSLCAVWLAWEKNSVRAFLATGALFGLSYLAKPEAVADFCWMLVLLALANWWRRSLKRSLPGLLVAVVAFALVISPYLLFLYRYTGRIMISGKLGLTYAAGLGAVEHDPGIYDRAISKLDAAGEEIIWFSPDRFKVSVWNLIKADPRGLMRRIWQNVNILESALFVRKVFPFYWLLLVGLGWFGSAWDRERLVKELFLVAAALPVFIFLPFHIEVRYFSPMFPILLLWVAKGIVALGDWLQETAARLRPGADAPRLVLSTRRGNSAVVVTAVLSIAFLAYFTVLQPVVVADGLADMTPTHREAGLWLKAHASVDAMVMSRDTEVPFYAERRWAATPNEEYPVFIAYLRRRGANYLVVDEREVQVIRPQLAFLAGEGAPPPELRHVYTARDPRGDTIVYEVLY